jgi:hypothetical protein
MTFIPSVFDGGIEGRADTVKSSSRSVDKSPRPDWSSVAYTNDRRVYAGRREFDTVPT